MSTRGAFGFKKDGINKLIYCHSNGNEDLRDAFLSFLNLHTHEEIIDIYNSIIWVDNFNDDNDLRYDWHKPIDSYLKSCKAENIEANEYNDRPFMYAFIYDLDLKSFRIEENVYLNYTFEAFLEENNLKINDVNFISEIKDIGIACSRWVLVNEKIIKNI